LIWPSIVAIDRRTFTATCWRWKGMGVPGIAEMDGKFGVDRDITETTVQRLNRMVALYFATAW